MKLRNPALFSWLKEWTPTERSGRLEAIYRAPAKGEPMELLEAVRVIAGGLEGDRYALGRGHWIKTDACAVTLSAHEDIERANRKASGRFAQGEHRRNLVVSGIPIAAYRGRLLRIGEVVFRYHRLRPPCGYLERMLWRGASKALGKASGIGLYVEKAGTIRVGDRAELIDP
ncbi:MAG: MOSC domain-containing protein [Gammaproteobacteria bacterium]